MECFMIFQRALERELRGKIQGDVKVILLDGACKAKINYDYQFFGYTVYDLPMKIIHGLSTKEVANEIAGAYKKWLLHRYFKEERGLSYI